jgi:hypothetical protein
MLTFNETGAAQAVEAIRSILGLNGDVRLQVEFEAGLHPNLLAYEKIQPSGIKLPSIEKYLIGTTSMLHQPTNYFDAIHVWRCACMVQYIHAALEVLTAKQIRGLNARLIRLARESSYDALDAVAFELIAAAQYAVHPAVTHLEFTPETPEKVTPDFAVRFAGVDSSVECKKIDRAKNYTVVIREIVRKRLGPVLLAFRESGISALAELVFNVDPRGVDQHRLVEASQDALRWQTAIIEPEFTIKVVRLGPYDSPTEAHFPSHYFNWHRYQHRVRSEWFGIVHNLSGTFLRLKDLPKDLQGGRCSLLNEVEWDAAVKWRISSADVIRKYRQFTFERVFGGLDQIKNYGMNSAVHLWLESDFSLSGRKDSFLDLFNRLVTNQRDVFGWLTINETMFEASPKGRYALTESAHMIRGPTAIGSHPLVSGVFAPDSAGDIGEFGTAGELPDIDE